MPTLPYSLSIQTGSKKVAFYPNKWDELCEFDLIGYELRIFGQTKMNFKTHITFTLSFVDFWPKNKEKCHFTILSISRFTSRYSFRSCQAQNHWWEAFFENHICQAQVNLFLDCQQSPHTKPSLMKIHPFL